MPTILTDEGVTFPNTTTQNSAPTSSATASSPGHNYVKFPSGLIINFGYQQVTASSMNITFAQPFSTAAYSIVGGMNASAATDTSGHSFVQLVTGTSLTTTGVRLSVQNISTHFISYMAIGR